MPDIRFPFHCRFCASCRAVSNVFLSGIFVFFCMTVSGCVGGLAQVNVLTANGSNDRTNANLQETKLTPANVSPGKFGKLGSLAVDGQIYSQPLYVSGLSFPNHRTHNVVFVSTLHNSVYAYDADSVASPSLLWHVNLGPSVPSSMVFTTYADVSPEVGILSTGVIDLQRQALYVVAETLVHDAPVFCLHALDLTTGAEKMNGPVVVSATVPGTGVDALSNNLVPFVPVQHLQRPGLLETNDAVYIGFGSHADQPPWHGWLMSYDASDLSKQTGVFMSTPNGWGGAIWQSGRGLAADDQGNIYLITGNGEYDGVQSFSESFVKLAGAGATLVDWFTPDIWQDLSDSDSDLAAGPALIPGTHTILGGDKNAAFYLINGDSMGQLSAPVPGQSLWYSGVVNGGMFNFAVFPQPNGAYIYMQGFQDPLKSFQLAAGAFNPVPISVAASTVDSPRVGLTISANGASNGIVWETTANFSDPSLPGMLHAYDALDLTSELWNSDLNASRDGLGAFSKFATPTVANGMVYVPTSSGTLVVYGLFMPGGPPPSQPAIASAGNSASYYDLSIAPGEVITIFGSNLGPSSGAVMQVDNSGVVSTNLAGTEAFLDGVALAVIYASSTQVSAVVPFGLSSPTAGIQIEYQGQSSDPLIMQVTPSAPGIFSFDGSGKGQALILNQDGSLNSASHPAAPGSTIVFFLTGAGQTSPAGQDGTLSDAAAPVQTVQDPVVKMGGEQTPVLSMGTVPGSVAGLIQMQVRVPADIAGGPAIPLAVGIGDGASQSGITIAVAAAPGD
jgi:uncharacterized protein (TIGR03437 family)